MNRYLFINPFGIGDVLFTTPVVRAIKNRYPRSFMGYWCNERVEGILKNNRTIDKTFALSRGDLKRICELSKFEALKRFFGLLRSIRKEKFEVALDFSLDHRYALLAKLLGIKKRIGFNYKKRGFFLTDKIDIEGYSKKHVVEYYLDLLKFLDIEPASYKLELAVEAAVKTKVSNLLAACGVAKEDLVAVIAPAGGVSWGSSAAIKHWPARKFARLSERLNKELRLKVLLVGDAAERGITEVVAMSAAAEVIDWAGKTTLEELAAVIERSDIFIANDGGPLHMAAALGKKTVSFFGPVDPKVYGPYPPDPARHIVLRRELECSPCYQNFRFSGCLKDKECLNAIEVEEAFGAVKKLLEK